MGSGKELSASEKQEVEKAANAEPWVHEVMLCSANCQIDMDETIFTLSLMWILLEVPHLEGRYKVPFSAPA